MNRHMQTRMSRARSRHFFFGGLYGVALLAHYVTVRVVMSVKYGIGIVR